MSRPPTPHPCPPDDPHWDNDSEPEMMDEKPLVEQERQRKLIEELGLDKKEPPEGGK